MPRQLLIILLGLFANTLLGQNLNYKDYCINREEVFSKIDSNYIFDFIRELKIINLTEIKFKYDTLSNIMDSSVVNYYHFDSLGRILEHRYDFRFNSSKFISEQFRYTENGLTNKIVLNPYGFDIFDGMTVSEKLIMYCEYRNKSYQIETIDVKNNGDSEIYTMHFYYNNDLFVKHFYYFEYLISELDILKGNKLEFKHVIRYLK